MSDGDAESLQVNAQGELFLEIYRRPRACRRKGCLSSACPCGRKYSVELRQLTSNQAADWCVRNGMRQVARDLALC